MKMSDVRVSWLSVAFIALGTMTSIYLISQLKFDYDFEDFFPKNDHETEYYLEFRKSFETDNDFFFVAI
jgi:predicted RND superfamily exporter protein